jgi:GT2 family glycosyltransferase
LKIAIAILNWNGATLLRKFLPKIVAYSPSAIADIYVIDNASTDDSVSYVKENFSQVKVIENQENGGYAKGYNDGLKHIEADVFALVNSDIEVTEDWLDSVLKHLAENPQTAMIQPKILDYKDKSFFEYAGAAGGFIDSLGYPYCRGRVFESIEQDTGQYESEAEIFWASGACFFIRKETFWRMGGFDEAYFAHQEEIDLAWRVFNNDYKAYYIPESVVYHVGGATLSHSHPKKTFLNFRNSLFNLVKNAPKHFPFLVLLRLLLDGIVGLKFLWEGKYRHIISIIKAHFSFYKHIPYLLKKRKELPRKKQNYFRQRSIVWQYFVLRKKQ